MAFTASLLRIDKGEDRILGIVVYTDGATTVIDRIVLDRLTAASFKTTVAARIAQLAGAAFVNTLTLGAIDTTPDPVVPPPDPTPDEVARRQYAKDLSVLRAMKQAIADGTMRADDQAFVDQAALVQREFLPTYLTGTP